MHVPMELLKELGVTNTKELCLLLGKNLYGLKQAGRQWYLHLHQKIIEGGFKQSLTENCACYNIVNGDTVVIGVCSDDLLVTGTSDDAVLAVFDYMHECLEVSGIEVLGMRINYTEDQCTFDQKLMVNELN